MLKIKTIQNFAFQNDLWQKGSKIIVGVSGGPDSVCLLNILVSLADKYKFELHIAHVNYALRGEDSLEDEKHVRQLAKKFDLPISILKPKKSEYKGNLENALREIRYNFFEQLRKELNFDLIAIAHNQDDQAETVLMRIIRGSGLNGLSAIKAKSGNIIRPLLDTSRNEIIDYLKEKKLFYRIDKSNSDIKFTRNHIRHKLLPFLEENYNPAIKKTLSEWSLSVGEDYAFIQQEAEKFVFAVCKNKKAQFCVLTFLDLHSSIQNQVIRGIYKHLKNTSFDLESKQVLEIIKLLKSTKNKSQKAKIGGLNLLKKGDNIDIFC